MSLAKVNCFTNQSWRLSPQFMEATLWRRYADVAYGRKDGHIIQSRPINGSKPIPEPFDINGLFAIYKVTYGLADFSDNINRTSQVEATVRYQMVFQVLEWLGRHVGVEGAQGDEDHYWSTMAGRLLLLWPLVDYVNDRTSSEVTMGSSANQSTRLKIPVSSVACFLVIFLSIVIWAACCLWSVSVGVIPPNSSLYPEIDFGSKCVQFERERLETDATDIENLDVLSNGMGVLYPLSNAESKTIVRELNTVNLHAGSMRTIEMEYPHITLATRRNELKPLRCGVEYR